MRQPEEGLRSEALREALKVALQGEGEAQGQGKAKKEVQNEARLAKLEDLLCRHGDGAHSRPNLRLAAAVGAEIASLPPSPVRLLTRLGSDDAAPDDPRVFLPIAAAHGWVALLRANRHGPEAWAALGELAADERGPVRVGTLDALSVLASANGGALALVTNAPDWLQLADLDRRFSAAALVVEALGERRILARIAGEPQLLDYLSRTIQELADAPRSAERLEGRRRLLMSLPTTLATVVSTLGMGDQGPAWFERLCASAEHPHVRRALSDTILRLRKTALGPGSATAQRLRQALESTAKPLRDPSRLRPGSGRGKASRPMR